MSEPSTPSEFDEPVHPESEAPLTSEEQRRRAEETPPPSTPPPRGPRLRTVVSLVLLVVIVFPFGFDLARGAGAGDLLDRRILFYLLLNQCAQLKNR